MGERKEGKELDLDHWELESHPTHSNHSAWRDGYSVMARFSKRVGKNTMLITNTKNMVYLPGLCDGHAALR